MTCLSCVAQFAESDMIRQQFTVNCARPNLSIQTRMLHMVFVMQAVLSTHVLLCSLAALDWPDLLNYTPSGTLNQSTM